jgi:hypothetical protein
MKRASLVGLGLFLITSPAGAAEIHLKGGTHAEPTFFDLGTDLRVSGELAGLGMEALTVDLTATGNPTATCHNPGNDENLPPGQNPAEVTVSGTVTIQPDAISKNGNAAFAVEAVLPSATVAGAPECPNPNWIETITDIAYTSATITVTQGSNTFTVTCTFSPATSDGLVPAQNVSCTSS